LPCMKKEEPPKYREETYKITFLGSYYCEIWEIQENISKINIWLKTSH
jgi:hypothetical protein